MKKLLYPRKRFSSILIENQRLTPTVCRLGFSIPDDCDFFSYGAGQYVTMQARIRDKMEARSYSLAAACRDEKKIEFCVKKINDGVFSPYLWDLPLGSEVKIIGPMGYFVLQQGIYDRPLVFIATGTGVAPLRAMIQSLTMQKEMKAPHISLFFGVRYVREVLFAEEWDILRNRFSDHFFHAITVTRPEMEDHGYHVGRVDDLLKKHSQYIDGALFFVCGLMPMIESVKKWLVSMNVAEQDIFYEKYD